IGDIIFFFILSHVAILGFIFWLLTSLAEYFYSKKEYKLQRDFYECGFKATSDLHININPSFFIFAILLILYDVEFTLLIPYILSAYTINISSFTAYVIFFFLIILSFYIDWRLAALN
ncbi:UNVERIFIED_CONTAM: hypothetical protein GTU68_000991, partial [Idotea baltica]|nr:hypothetical protein [Idotea baltica]